MHPVVAVLLGRAEAARARLVELTAAVPEPLWRRRAAAAEWTAREHLGHALSSDAVVAVLVSRFEEAAFADLPALRLAALERAVPLAIEDLLATAARERDHLRRVLAGLPPGSIERSITFPGALPGVRFSLLAYLEAWAVHDTEHELAIREAIAVPPDLSAVAHARRLS